MMKIVEGFFACVFLINCAYVVSYDSPGEGLWCPIDLPSGVNASAEPQCDNHSNITCPSGQGCCVFLDDAGNVFVICVNLNEEPTDCFDNGLLHPYGVTSVKHGEEVSTCSSKCSCNNGHLMCGDNICFPAGLIVLLIAIFGIPVIAAIVGIYANTHTKGDNPPSYKKAVRMPISISETIKEDAASPPTYDEAVNIA